MKRRLYSVLTALCLLLVLVGCGGGGQSSNKTLTLYDGDYSEVQLVHAMIKLLVEENTDLTVKIKDQMTQVNMFKDLTGSSPTSDLMFSYDGTVLTTFLKLDATDIPAGQTLYDFTNEQARSQYNVYMLGKVGLNNTYAIGVTQAVVDTYGVKTISDLVPVAGNLVIAAEPEFFHSEGSMKFYPFVEAYGLEFKDSPQYDVMLKYTAIEQGSCDVLVVYATDGLNKRASLTILEDDLGFFPEYNGAILVQGDLFERFQDTAPNLEEVLSLLDGNISSEEMVELTYQVDVEGSGVTETATAFLQSKGLL